MFYFGSAFKMSFPIIRITLNQTQTHTLIRPYNGIQADTPKLRFSF